jgi:apolipoprotein N-acyltransferase
VVLRAAENRRWVVRAANTGISAIIDPFGRIVTRLGFGIEGIVRGEVEAGEAVTPYARWGGEIRIALVVLAAGVIILTRRRRRGARQRAPVASPATR